MPPRRTPKHTPTHWVRPILIAMANGKSNKEIATEAGVTYYTAKSYVERLLRQLGARDRANAVALALKHRIITIDDIN